jgi:hypothetical protein
MATAKKWDDLLDLSFVGQTFELDGKTYKFTRFMPYAKSNSVVGVGSDGKERRFDAVQVARAFAKQAASA